MIPILFPLGRDRVLSIRVKAKVDHLNLVFVILNLVSVAGKLSARVHVCARRVASVSFKSVRFYCYFSLLLEACLVVLWCLMLPFGKSQPLREHCPVE